MFEGVVTRASDPGANQGISRDCVRLRLKATHLLSVPSKGGSLKPLGTLAGNTVAAATLSATRRAMSEAVIPAGEVVVVSAAVASEMEARGKSLAEGNFVPVLDDTVVAATEGGVEAPLPPYPRASTCTTGGTGGGAVSGHPPGWRAPATEAWLLG